MGENIEVKDVQKTEYLDKNGLDMLWAKVKENTRNQVEVERNRAVAKENSIIDTKADKSALDNYVLSTTLTALEQKVTDNTTAISAKQDKPDDGNMFLQVKHDSVSGYFKRNGELKFTYDDNDTFYTSISPSGIYCWNENSPINFLRIKSNGITIDGGEGTSGYAFTTDGKTAHIPTKTSQLINDSKFIPAYEVDGDTYILHGCLKVWPGSGGVLTINSLGIDSTGGDGFKLDGTGIRFFARGISDIPTAQGDFIDIDDYALNSQVTALEQTVTNNTTALKGKQDKGNYLPYKTVDKYSVYSVLDGAAFKFENLKGFENSEAQIDGLGVSVTDKKKQIGTFIRSNSISISDDGGSKVNISDRNGGQILVNSQYNGSSLTISKDGITLLNGDNNHVLTSNASTIDITQYVLKIEYNEKIAALEARIAALEAKHTEAAA